MTKCSDEVQLKTCLKELLVPDFEAEYDWVEEFRGVKVGNTVTFKRAVEGVTPRKGSKWKVLYIKKMDNLYGGALVFIDDKSRQGYNIDYFLKYTFS